MIVGNLIPCTVASGGSVDSPVDVDLTCSATEVVGNAVYMFSDDVVKQANNTLLATASVIGFIASKATSTSCTVRMSGALAGFSGLEVGKDYFLDSVNGGITKTPPTTGVLALVGRPISATEFGINISNNIIERT